MRRNFISLTVIVLILMSTASCSVVRVIENRQGYGIRQTAARGIKERQNQLSRRDFQMKFNATGSELSLRLQYLPYYKVESQKIVRYRPEMTLVDFVLGLASAALITKVTYDRLGIGAHLDEHGLDGFNPEELRFDWAGATTWEKAVLIGIPADLAMYYIIGEFEWTLREPWEQKSEVQGTLQWLDNHPYRIELPAYNFGKDYVTQSGNESISVSEFLSGIEDPSAFLEIESIELRASTEGDEKRHEKTITLSNPAELRAFRYPALAALGIDMLSTGQPSLMPIAAANARWVKGSLHAGETATLKVTVENKGKGELYGVSALTVSSHPTFSRRKLEFGKINPGESQTLTLPFKTDALMRTQDVPIRLRFGEYNDHVPDDIVLKLQVVEEPRPRFSYEYRIIDGGTDNSVGNSDGTIQRGESVDIRVIVENIGEGTAEGTVAQLNLSGESGIKIYGDSSVNLHNIAPASSKIATFNVGVNQNTSVEALRMNLFIADNKFGDTNLTDTIDVPINEGGSRSEKPNREERSAASTGIQSEPQTKRDSPDTVQRPPTSEPQTKRDSPDTVQSPPTLILVKPELKEGKFQTEVSSETLQFIAFANDDKGIDKIELSRNKELVKTAKKRGVRPDRRFTIDVTVPLTYGGNLIEIIAFDTDGQTSEPLIISVTRTLGRQGQDYALLFATDAYNHWSPLQNPIHDAKTISEILKNTYDFQVELVENPTQEQIFAKLREYTEKQYNPDDQLMLFFAAHGDFDEVHKEGHIVALDSKLPSSDLARLSYIPHTRLSTLLESIPCKHLLLVLDTCFSGTFDERIAQRGGSDGVYKGHSRAEFIRKKLDLKGRLYLTSGGKEYVSDGRPGQHSPFARQIIQALREYGGADGILTFNEIKGYIEKVKPSPYYGEFGSNEPGSDFLFIAP